MLSKMVMLKVEAAVSATCARMPGHWNPKIAPAQNTRMHCTDF